MDYERLLSKSPSDSLRTRQCTIDNPTGRREKASPELRSANRCQILHSKDQTFQARRDKATSDYLQATATPLKGKSLIGVAVGIVAIGAARYGFDKRMSDIEADEMAYEACHSAPVDTGSGDGDGVGGRESGGGSEGEYYHKGHGGWAL
jgi:hypothetical protein